MFVTSHVQISLFFVKMEKVRIYEKKFGGHRAFKEVKSLRCCQSDCLFTLSLIAWHFREDPGPQLSHDATWFYVPFLWKMFAPLPLARCHVCLPSWSAMHDECVTCAKKCGVAMGANVLKCFEMFIFLYDKQVSSLQRLLLEVNVDITSPFPAFSIPSFKAFFLPVTTRSNFFFSLLNHNFFFL